MNTNCFNPNIKNILYMMIISSIIMIIFKFIIVHSFHYFINDYEDTVYFLKVILNFKEFKCSRKHRCMHGWTWEFCKFQKNNGCTWTAKPPSWTKAWRPSDIQSIESTVRCSYLQPACALWTGHQKMQLE